MIGVLFNRYDELDENTTKTMPYSFVEGDVGETWLKCPYSPEGLIRPEDITSEIVRYLLQSVKDAYKVEEISKCVISVPAYFNERQREATVAAVEALLSMSRMLCNERSLGIRSVGWFGESTADS